MPFDALSGFFDPSVQFGLKFDLSEAARPPRRRTPPRPSPARAGPVRNPARCGPRAPVSPRSAPARRRGLPAPAAQGEKAAGKSDDKAPRPAAKKEGEEGSAEVVSLDAFRKKS